MRKKLKTATRVIDMTRMKCTYIFLSIIIIALTFQVFGADEYPPLRYPIKKLATFESLSGPVYLGNNSTAREFTAMVLSLNDKGEFDSALTAKENPGWNGESWEFFDYKWHPGWREEIGHGYTNRPDTLFLPGDTIYCEYECFDEDGKINLKINTGLPKKLFPNSYKVKYFQQVDLDGNGQKENILAFTDETYEYSPAGRPPFSIVVYNLTGNRTTIRLWEDFPEAGKIGRLEIRDVTGDGLPDIVFRVFWPGGTGYTDEVHIYGAEH